jgi:putative endonuclease
MNSNPSPAQPAATNYAAGMTGQQAAEAFLIKKGLQILARNYRLKSGEIDLIAADGTYLVFIEVKTRSSTRHGYGREAVNSLKQRRIIKTALHYVVRYHQTERDMRFDVIEVAVRNGDTLVEHIENAFTA